MPLTVSHVDRVSVQLTTDVHVMVIGDFSICRLLSRLQMHDYSPFALDAMLPACDEKELLPCCLNHLRSGRSAARSVLPTAQVTSVLVLDCCIE